MAKTIEEAMAELRRDVTRWNAELSQLVPAHAIPMEILVNDLRGNILAAFVLGLWLVQPCNPKSHCIVKLVEEWEA